MSVDSCCGCRHSAANSGGVVLRTDGGGSVQTSCALSISVLRECAIAAYFAYFSRVPISHIFPHKLASSTGILIFLLFLLPISIRFRYLDHLVANRMAPSMCPDPCGMRWGSWFQVILCHISAAYWCLCDAHIF